MTNIDIAPDISLSDLRGKPLTIVCEIVEGHDGQPALRALHPYRLTKRMRAKDEPFYRLERK